MNCLMLVIYDVYLKRVFVLTTFFSFVVFASGLQWLIAIFAIWVILARLTFFWFRLLTALLVRVYR